MSVFNVWEAELAVDDDEPDGYRAPYARIGPAIGADKLSATLVVLRDGEALCPYHYELVEEEWLIVLGGTPTVRTPDGEEVCAPGDVVCFAPGPAGAHQIANHAAAPARVIMLAERRHPAATVYPDSDKLGIFLATEPRRTLVRRGDAVGYWADEPPFNDDEPRRAQPVDGN